MRNNKYIINSKYVRSSLAIKTLLKHVGVHLTAQKIHYVGTYDVQCYPSERTSLTLVYYNSGPLPEQHGGGG